ncbi:hypothetical protein HaLaN_16969 [Haematococcus lacustris]|uniref:Uncharacterized protein n=1 Tax=Haematococcus lacustris TaxID=44745 RepID=A0A699ZDN2_HAELA|nr:hypothetical protein HaLaN_16969 [Haematococcus lacustris]
MDWVTAAYLPLHSLTHPLHLYQLVGAMMEDVEIGDIDMEDIEEPSIEVLAAAELNLCERNKAGLVLDGALWLSKATVDMLTEQHLSHSRHTAHQPSHPAVASSSSFEGQITPGGPGSSTGQGGQQGPAAGAQPLMQRLSRCVKAVHIKEQGLNEELLSPDEQEALDVMFPVADVSFVPICWLGWAEVCRDVRWHCHDVLWSCAGYARCALPDTAQTCSVSQLQLRWYQCCYAVGKTSNRMCIAAAATPALLAVFTTFVTRNCYTHLSPQPAS